MSLLYFLAFFGAWRFGLWLWRVYHLLFVNRNGNSGRYKHWTVEDEWD